MNLIETSGETCRCFLSYNGIKLPLKLVSELEPGEENNRNTFYRGYFDADNRLLRCEMLVYGEIELLHLYTYYDDGGIKQAEVRSADETALIHYDESGVPVI